MTRIAGCSRRSARVAEPNSRQVARTLRLLPPAVLLGTKDPYFSIWSVDDELAQDSTRYWTGTGQPLGVDPNRRPHVPLDGEGQRCVPTSPVLRP